MDDDNIAIQNVFIGYKAFRRPWHNVNGAELLSVSIYMQKSKTTPRFSGIVFT